MSKIFFDKVGDICPAAMDRMVGYSESELEMIERLYDIKIWGDFACFMRRAGRSDGGLVGDDPFIIYRPTWSVRAQVLFQVSFFDSLQEIGAWDYLNDPFVFSWEAETQYYFLQTGVQGVEHVYHYDENTGRIGKTGLTFSEYLLDVVSRYPLGRPICQGELLKI